MRIALVTDAWEPQVNGVVTTLRHTCRELQRLDHSVLRISPERFASVPCPSYPEIRLAVAAGQAVARELDGFDPDAVHIATEGPLGLAARAACHRRGWRFTTSYHTRFPEYVRARWPIPLAATYGYLRWFHSGAARTLVATATVRHALAGRRFRRLVPWSRGVDATLFRPQASRVFSLRGPIAMFVGRVAVEKGIEDFLAVERPGSKVVVGDGPQRRALQARHTDVLFTGVLHGASLAAAMASADVFVFPSRTDTFGVVMLEAMACGVPVAAYPVAGPIDVVREGLTGSLRDDLGDAIDAALRLDRHRVRAAALEHGWGRTATQFLDSLVSALPARHRAARIHRASSRSAWTVPKRAARAPKP